MSLVLQSGNAAFKPRARLLKLIGAELISDDVLAITELVKNAHDADASRVTITFHDVGSRDGSIVVTDDGSGMNLNTLLRNWMEPAGTSKVGVAKVTQRGRRVLGEKGVGRFAVDKLARHLELFSRSEADAGEIHAAFDWDCFESDHEMLDDVTSRWEVREPRELLQLGTKLVMRGLRSRWTERMFKRLSSKLARLRSPFQRGDDFSIVIESDEFPEYAGEQLSNFLERAPYQIDAVFDGDASISIHINGNEVAEHATDISGSLNCGPVTVKLFAFDLETESLARIGPRMEVRAWLKEWCGISVYRDGFRVWPYGEPHDDWLRLDQRRVNNPVLRLSNNQIVGFVEISGDGNEELRDQTSREGLISNRAVLDLRRLIVHALEALETSRHLVRHSVSAPLPIVGARQQDLSSIQGTIERLAGQSNEPVADELRRLGTKINELIAGHETRTRKVEEVYGELAAAGQIAIASATSLKTVSTGLQSDIATLQAQISQTGGDQRLVSRIEANLRDLNNCVAMLAPASESRRRRTIDARAEILNAERLLHPMLEKAGLDRLCVNVSDEVIRIEMRPLVFHQLIQILVTNAAECLDGRRNARIEIGVIPHDDGCVLVLSDNGPGIPTEIADRVFDPTFSRKEGGRGLGLTIARSIVTSHGGEIWIDTARSPGTTVMVRLPRKRARATLH